MASMTIIGCGGASPAPVASESKATSSATADPGPTAQQEPHVCPCRAVVEQARPVQETPASETSTEGAESDDESEENTGLPPLYLIAENMDTTHFSGIVRIDDAKVIDDAGGDPGDPGYVNHRYQVTVLQTRVGKTEPKITISEAAERGARPMKAGRTIFVSLCRSDTPGVYYTPDNGYVFDASEAVLKKIKQIKRSKKAPKSPSACQH